jgi:hypothetical protein
MRGTPQVRQQRQQQRQVSRARRAAALRGRTADCSSSTLTTIPAPTRTKQLIAIMIAATITAATKNRRSDRDSISRSRRSPRNRRGHRSILRKEKTDRRTAPTATPKPARRSASPVLETRPAPIAPPSLLAMVDALDPEAVREIFLLLSARLSPPPDPATYRREELSFLADILDLPEARDQESQRATPMRSYYDENKPPEAPNRQRLTDNYGSWTKACRAARGLIGAEPAARAWSHGFTGKRKPPDYTKDEIALAVLRCAAALGRMPSSIATTPRGKRSPAPSRKP